MEENRGGRIAQVRRDRDFENPKRGSRGGGGGRGTESAKEEEGPGAVSAVWRARFRAIASDNLQLALEPPRRRGTVYRNVYTHTHTRHSRATHTRGGARFQLLLLSGEQIKARAPATAANGDGRRR